MKKITSIAAFFLLALLVSNAQAQPKIPSLPLNMVIGVPELIIIALFSCMAITILIVVVKKVIHK